MNYTKKGKLSVATELLEFINNELIPGTKINPEKYKLLNLSKDKIDKTKLLFKELSEKFIWDKMNNLTLSDTKESFFHSAVSKETDELQKKINHNANFMDKLVDNN